VHNQHAVAIQLQHLLFRQQRHACRSGKAIAEEKIAVTVNEIAGNAMLVQIVQSGSNLRKKARKPAVIAGSVVLRCRSAMNSVWGIIR